MSDVLHARAGREHRRWEWQTEIDSHCGDLIALLAGSAAEDGILGYRTPPTIAAAAAFCADLQHRLAGGSGHVLLGADSAGIVAMCLVDIPAMPTSRHLGEVSKAYLVPRVRRTTAVVELAAAVCLRMREQDVETLRIDVREGTPAHHAWQRFGFITYGVLDDYSRVGAVRHRGHFMTHSVDRLAEFTAQRLDAAGVVLASGDHDTTKARLRDADCA